MSRTQASKEGPAGPESPRQNPKDNTKANIKANPRAVAPQAKADGVKVRAAAGAQAGSRAGRRTGLAHTATVAESKAGAHPGTSGARRRAAPRKLEVTASAPERPLCIGISARLLYQVPPELGFRHKTLQYVEQSLAHWIMEHGAVAFMVPAVAHDSKHAARHLKVQHVVNELDALVLQGGADVAPQTYGQQPLKPEWEGDVVRDRYELALLKEFLAQKKPVLGVCRGAQLLNVAFGGTLYQDIATQCPGAHMHVDSDLYDQMEHDVTFLQGSSLAALYPTATQLRVTSIHHQAVAELGKGLVVEAFSTIDGLTEAIRWTGDGYARGVQWHPEFHHGRAALIDSSPIMLDFLRAAREAVLGRQAAGIDRDPRRPLTPLRLVQTGA